MSETANKHVAICSPLHDQRVHSDFALALGVTMPLAAQAGINISWHRCGGHANLPRARNLTVATAMASGADEIFLIDSDIGWDPKDFVRLCQADADVIGGAQERRTLNETREFACSPLEQPRAGEPFRSVLTATSFLRVTRRVLDALAASGTAPRFEYASLPEEAQPYLRAYFQYELCENRFDGEDTWFCRKAREHGFDVWVDPTVRLRHYGAHCFDACLDDFLQLEQEKVPQDAAG